MLDKLNIPQPPNGLATNEAEALECAKRLGYPFSCVPASCSAGARCRSFIPTPSLQHYMRFAVEASPERPVLVDKFLEDATEVDVDCITDVGQFDDPSRARLSSAGCWSTSSSRASFWRRRDGAAATHAFGESHRDHPRIHARDGKGVESHRPDERAVRGEGRLGVRAGGQSARLAQPCRS
jgi:hypothetical protein